MFSKSFGYALRGILYLASLQDEHRKIQVDEIAMKLGVPRHFMGKILKNLAKHGIIQSTKGPYGGFYVTDKTLSSPVLQIVFITDGDSMFKKCSLHLQECSTQNPCPLHGRLIVIREALKIEFTHTKIADLLPNDRTEFIKSIATPV
jgi:Rrf2 family transcriptional regulator, iron-sulfur cluster assembly transcription factor